MGAGVETIEARGTEVPRAELIPPRTAPPKGGVGCRQPTCLGTCGASLSRSVCLNSVSEVLPLFFGKV